MKKFNEVINNLVDTDEKEKGGKLEVFEKAKTNDPILPTTHGISPPP